MKKIGFLVAFFVLSLFFVPITHGENTIPGSSDITIRVHGGFFPYVIICNNGTTSLFNVSIMITIEGPFVISGSGIICTIDEMHPGDSVICGQVFILGFGPITITITISYDDGTISETFEGFLLGFFLLLY